MPVDGDHMVEPSSGITSSTPVHTLSAFGLRLLNTLATRGGVVAALISVRSNSNSASLSSLASVEQRWASEQSSSSKPSTQAPASVLWLLSTSSDSSLILGAGVPSCSPSSLRSALPHDAAVGVPERDRDNLAFRWKEPALLHQLLMYSGLKFGGGGTRPMWSAGKDDTRHPGTDLYCSMNTGNVNRFMSALDLVVASADELALLCAWAVIHLWRPF